MSRESRQRRRQNKEILNKVRWAGYAAAGAATVLGAGELAEAGIIHPNPINVHLDGSNGWNMSTQSLTLDVNDDGIDDLRMIHRGFTYSTTYSPTSLFGVASAWGLNGARIAGTAGVVPYAAKLGTSQTVDSAMTFLPSGQAYMAYLFGSPGSQFTDPGEGFLGFSFDADGGTHYGWLRVIMDDDGFDSHNAYTVVDYAYESVAGAPIHIADVPEPGSLGLLATGAVGLLLWRRVRRGNKPAA